ncbi:MAG: pyridoxal phosphate-dependent aminotransferase [Gammaproteobacteria bacterium]|nr:pyridoxal phosphate-dependent aminotransferase [Gammaproteobacteria bacterium]
MSLNIIRPDLRSLPMSKTLAVSALANRLKSEGKEVLNLAVGEPDFDTPEFIGHAAIEAIRGGKTKYTLVGGTSELKKAICHKFKRDNDLIFTPDQVMASTGCKQVLYNVLMATLEPGDEVIVPAPYWPSYPAMIKLFQGKPIIVDCPREQSFLLKPHQLDAAITEKTKWLMLNYPSNPTGAVYSKADLLNIIAVLKNHPHVWVLSDEIYGHLTYAPSIFYSIGALDAEVGERIVTANGLSKSHSMTGWRLGFCGGHPELIRVLTNLQSQSTTNPCSITQAAAVAALNGDNDIVFQFRDAFYNRIKMFVELLSDTKLKIEMPQGAFYVFIDVSAYDKDDVVFAEALLKSEYVAVVPGAAFGDPGHVRLSCAASEDELEEAAKRIKKFLATLD